MASSGVGVVPARLSFAKVAAMKVPMSSIPTEIPNKNNEERSKSGPTARRSTVIRNPAIPSSTPAPQNVTGAVEDENAAQSISNGMTGAIEGLSYVSQQSKSTNGNTSGGSAGSIEEDRSHLSTSSTKQHSFDTKSVASATTFAMDEKESIRPDDSASVRAVDDEDASSTLGRSATYTHDSDAVLPPSRAVLPRPVGGSVTLANRRFQTLINPPRFGDLEAEPISDSSIEVTTPLITPSTIQEDGLRAPVVPVHPDERLLDALASPKDRLSILQLEERLIFLTKQSEVEFIDLPPQNSYARLLSHKLADYYGLMHHITEDGMSVRIFRGVEIEAPIPLATLAKSIPVGPLQPPHPTAVKIMRRAGLNDSTAPSSSASKATSEADHSEEGLASPTDSTPNRDKSKMTREEREAQYKAVRERIFGDFQELSVSESNSTGENSADMSRSSSSSGKKKNTRRQKTPKDDSFEARSAFVANYTHTPGMNPQATYQPNQYVDPHLQDFYAAQAPFFGQQMNYGTTPTQAHPGFDSHMATSTGHFVADARHQYGGMDSWSPVSTPSYYGFPSAQPQNAFPSMNQSTTQMNHHFGTMPPPGMQQQAAWPNAQFPASFAPHATSSATGGPWGSTSAYGYGQQPPPQGLGGSTVSSPGSGSGINRSLFNPQTRSFIPSNSSSRTGSRNTNRKKAAPGANPIQTQPGRMHTPPRQSSTGQSGGLPFPTRSQFAPQGSNQDGAEESLQKKYGTPANLPKKPPPSQVQQHFDHGGLGVRNPIAVGPSHTSQNGSLGKSDNISA